MPGKHSDFELDTFILQRNKHYKSGNISAPLAYPDFLLLPPPFKSTQCLKLVFIMLVHVACVCAFLVREGISSGSMSEVNGSKS